MEDIHTLRRNCSGLGHEWALLTGVGKGRSQWLWVGCVGEAWVGVGGRDWMWVKRGWAWVRRGWVWVKRGWGGGG